ncbi:hypothetical protein COW46_00200 [Candidatus Gracilibacteria bacterium CG17_big_fil_post_rev_8_21_14_2_50_48_13]|nr:MAG: hypothetical protein COW46_00200 [Candidatus Gracilibacteria bacterium CG17_big_fil_post_rev_8_21_14_2_50_48_13]
MLTTLKKIIRHDSPLRLGYHALMGWGAAALYGFPARKMVCIGITGTDGKTTTTFLTTDLLRRQGVRVGMASTVGFRIGDTYEPNPTHKTTMGRLGLQKLLRRMVREGCTHAVLEVSSHGLVQSRLAGIPFQVAAITNLSREHLDYHGTMEKYKEAKGKLFRITSRHPKAVFVVGKDFPESAYYLKERAKTKLLFGWETKSGDAPAEPFLAVSPPSVHERGQDFDIIYGGQRVPCTTSLMGNFNVLNIAAAIGIGLGLSFSFDSLVSSIKELTSVPGRMEILTAKDGKRAVIDYAVTPEALTKLYATLRSMTSGKVIAVLGACGDRDQGKRPIMGAIASQLTDFVFLTDEEPYTEDPAAIIAMLESGAKKEGKGNYKTLLSRREAIETALAMAAPEDIVVVSGMGDQTSRIVGGDMEPWSDREEILAAMHRAE